MSDLYRVDIGTGDPLVLLHGGFLDHRMWDDQLRVFAERHRVIAPDARGHGRSPNATGPFRLTDDVAELLDGLGTGPAVLAGVSMGASTAVETALEHPSLVRAVVITGAGTGEPYFEDPWTLQALTAWHAAMAAGDLDGSVETFLRLGAGPYQGLDDVDPEVVRRLREMATGTMSKHSAGEAEWLVPVKGGWERVAEIAVPVLAVHGALDSPDHVAMAGRVVRTAPDARAVTIDGASHYPNLERPDAYNAALMEFLAAL